MKKFTQNKKKWIKSNELALILLLSGGGCEFAGHKTTAMPKIKPTTKPDINEDIVLPPWIKDGKPAKGKTDKEYLVSQLTYHRSKYLVHLYQQVGYAIWSMTNNRKFCCSKHTPCLQDKLIKYQQKMDKIPGMNLIKKIKPIEKLVQSKIRKNSCFRNELLGVLQELFDEIYLDSELCAKLIGEKIGIPEYKNIELIFWKKLKPELVVKNFISNLQRMKDNILMKYAYSIDVYVNKHMEHQIQKLDQKTLENLVIDISAHEFNLRRSVLSKLEKYKNIVDKQPKLSSKDKNKWRLNKAGSKIHPDSGFLEQDKEALLFFFTDYTDEILQYFFQKYKKINQDIVQVLVKKYENFQKNIYNGVVNKQNIIDLLNDNYDQEIDEKEVKMIDSLYMFLERFLNTLVGQYQAMIKASGYDFQTHPSLKFWREINKIDKDLAKISSLGQQFSKNMKILSDENKSIDQEKLTILIQRLKIVAKSELINQIDKAIRASSEAIQASKVIFKTIDVKKLKSLLYFGSDQVFGLFKPDINNVEDPSLLNGGSTMVGVNDFIPIDQKYQYNPLVAYKPISFETNKDKITAAVINDIKQDMEVIMIDQFSSIPFIDEYEDEENEVI